MNNSIEGFKKTIGKLFQIFTLIVFVVVYANGKELKYTAKKPLGDTLNCILPTFTLSWTDVTQPNANDAKLIITNIRSANRYAYALESEKSKLTYDKALPISLLSKTLEIKNIPNPATTQKYVVRLFNGSDKCFSDQSVTFEHVNFAEGLDYADIEIIQLASNQHPAQNEEVTFTTIVVNKGNKATTGIEVQQVYSASMQIVYFYADRGNFDVVSRNWKIGTVAGGQTFTLVTKAKITQQGLSFLASYVSKQNEQDKDSNVRNAEAGEDDYAQTCVSVPITMDKGESFKVTMKTYEGIKWYYKNPSGKFEEVTASTSGNIAQMNSDSSLTIRTSGEFMYSKLRGGCRISSCCPIVVDGCKGPAISVDSIYCNQKVDSYNIEISLRDSDWNVAESVLKALGGLGAPAVTQALNNINKYPLSSSAGYVVSNGGNKYTVQNIPAFVPNVTLTSTDLAGKCFSYRVVKAPTCGLQMVQLPDVEIKELTYKKGETTPTLSASVADTKTTDVVWFDSELSKTPVRTGSTFQPDAPGVYYVAAKNRKTKQLSQKTAITLTEIAANEPAKTCSCDMAERLKSLTDAEIMLVSNDITVSKVYPNPADEFVTFDYIIAQNVQSAKLRFFGVAGNEIATYELNKADNKVKVNTLNWQEGLYMFQLSIDGKNVAANRIVITH